MILSALRCAMLTIPARHRCSISRIAYSTTALCPPSDQPAEHAEAPLRLQRGWYRDQERESRRPGRRRRYSKHDRLVCCCRQRRGRALETRLVQIREQVDNPLHSHYAARFATAFRSFSPPCILFALSRPYLQTPLRFTFANVNARYSTRLMPTACSCSS